MDTKTLTTGVGTAILTAVLTVVYIGSPIPKDQTIYTKIDDHTVQVTRIAVQTNITTLDIADLKKNLDNFNKAVAEAQAKGDFSKETQDRIDALRINLQTQIDTAQAAGVIIPQDIKP